MQIADEHHEAILDGELLDKQMSKIRLERYKTKVREQMYDLTHEFGNDH